MMLTPLLLSIYTISSTTAAIVPLIDPLSDSQFSTNSMHAHDSCEPWDAKYTVSHEHDGWCVADTNFGAPNGPYLEINFGRKTNIHAIGTKGRGCCTQYVTSYILSYYDGTTWIEYDSAFVFVGNNNNNGNYQQEVRHELIDYNGILVAAQYIRFYPITNVGTAAMRVEAYGNDWTASPTELPSKSPSLNPTLQPIHPTFQPTVSPNDVSFPPTQVTLPPTNDPTLTPTNDPTSDPTKHPTSNPTDVPTLGPSNNPTSSPSNPPTLPSLDPSKNPTSDPTVAPTFDPTNFTFNPTLTPSETPTVYTSNPTVSTNNPTLTRHDNGGEVDDETTAYNGSDQVDNENGLAADDVSGLPVWIVILAVCSGVLCCLACILIGLKTLKMKHSNKRKESDEDAFRMQANTELDGDLWSNPVHHQTDTHHRIVSNDHDSEIITGEGNILTRIVMNDISSDDSNQQVETVEMTGVNTNGTHEGPEDAIDYINNAVNAQNEDNELDIDNIMMMTPNGDNIDLITAGGDHDEIDNIINNNDEDVIDDIDNIVTKDITDMADDDDIDAINNNVDDEMINDVDHMITHGAVDDDDVMDDDLQHEMQTLGGDDDIIIDNMNINEDDDEDIIDDDFTQTIQ